MSYTITRTGKPIDLSNKSSASFLARTIITLEFDECKGQTISIGDILRVSDTQFEVIYIAANMIIGLNPINAGNMSLNGLTLVFK